jgi:hypothetical protein
VFGARAFHGAHGLGARRQPALRPSRRSARPHRLDARELAQRPSSRAGRIELGTANLRPGKHDGRDGGPSCAFRPGQRSAAAGPGARPPPFKIPMWADRDREIRKGLSNVSRRMRSRCCPRARRRATGRRGRQRPSRGRPGRPPLRAGSANVPEMPPRLQGTRKMSAEHAADLKPDQPRTAALSRRIAADAARAAADAAEEADQHRKEDRARGGSAGTPGRGIRQCGRGRPACHQGRARARRRNGSAIAIQAAASTRNARGRVEAGLRDPKPPSQSPVRISMPWIHEPDDGRIGMPVRLPSPVGALHRGRRHKRTVRGRRPAGTARSWLRHQKSALVQSCRPPMVRSIYIY